MVCLRGDPALAGVLGDTFPDAEEKDMLSIGVESNFVNSRDMEAEGDVTSTEVTDSHQVSAILGYQPADNLNTYLKFGTANLKQKFNWNVDRSQILKFEYGPFVSGGANLIHEFDNGFGVGVNSQISWWHTELDSVAGDNNPSATAEGSVNNYELLTTFYGKYRKDIGYNAWIVPYAGISLAYFRSDEDDAIEITDDTYVYSYGDTKNDEIVTLVAGLGVELADNWRFFLEGRFFDETAVSCGVKYAFDEGWRRPYKRRIALKQPVRDEGEYFLAEDYAAFPGWELTAELQGGGAEYEEHASSVDVDSKWNDFFGRVNLSLGNYDLERFEGGIKGSLFGTLEDTEKWYLNGSLYQNNDMYFTGGSFLAEAGIAIGDKEKPGMLIFTPLVGYGYNRNHFVRSNFVTSGTVSELGEVSEDYDVHYIDFGGKLNFVFNEKMLVDLRASCGVVVDNEADNSLLGTVDGHGGYIPKFDGKLKLVTGPDSSLNIGGFCEHQHLEGGTSGNVEWPDNDLLLWGFTLGATYKWGAGGSREPSYYQPPRRRDELKVVRLETVPERAAPPRVVRYIDSQKPVRRRIYATRPYREVTYRSNNGLEAVQRLDRLQALYNKGLVSRRKYIEEKGLILSTAQ